MNNEAFQKLVREKAGVKTTKEVAREAVEAEFKGGKRKRYSNDDDSDNERRKDRRVVKEKRQKEPSELDRLASKYRDRAKERREGKEDAPAQKKSASDQIFDDVVEAFESGDRRKLKQIRVVKEEGYRIRLAETADEAKAWIAEPRTLPTTALGREILDYLRKQYVPVSDDTTTVSAAGRNLQRSKLTFSWIADPRDRLRSWERPLEQTYSGIMGNSDVIVKATPCDEGLLLEMDACLEKHKLREAVLPHKAKGGPELVQPTEDEAVAASDSEGDDIFGNVGDYDGGAAAGSDDEGEPEKSPDASKEAAIPKGSFFGDKLESVGVPTDNRFDSGANAVEASKRSALVGFSSLPTDDDCIGMDFDGRDYEDEEEDKKALNAKNKKSSRRQRRTERSPS